MDKKPIFCCFWYLECLWIEIVDVQQSVVANFGNFERYRGIDKTLFAY